ncbi:MAG: PadR family transcriptional regulator [Gemmatimonadetes bacterium]|nr:PadR family transcriptional regulator [Gemmatimonadota bacterium]
MSVRNGILALLAEEPRHGYALKSEFSRRTAGTWELNVGQVYTTLARLRRDGLVAEDEPVDGPRHRWRVTGSGRGALEKWLGTPVDEAASRNELILKVLLALGGPPDRLRLVLDRQRAFAMERLQEYTRARPVLADAGDLSAELALDALVLRVDADLRWLDRCEQRVADRERESRLDRGSR